jgi:hypothetical protein
MSKSGKLQEVQLKVDDVTDIMRANIDKAIKRGEELDNLEKKADDLLITSDRFQKDATGLKRLMCWREKRQLLCLILLVLAIIGFIILFVCLSGKC